MRLFDKVAQRFLGATAKDYTVLVADTIAPYFLEKAAPETPIGDQFPFSMPPWNNTFVEFNFPCAGNLVPSAASFVDAEQHLAGHTQEQLQYSFGKLAAEYSEKQGVALRPGPYRCFYVSGFAELQGKIRQFVFDLAWTCTTEGHSCGFVVSDEFKIGSKDTEFLDGGISGRATQFMAHIALCAFSFANCKNVVTVDSTEAYSPDAKVLRRLKLPEVKRYTLTIDGHPTARTRAEPGKPSSEPVMPFHLCRGHFATYTAAKPLFGKYVGRFWVPPHTKGSKDRGEIIKDYKLPPQV